MNSSFIQEYIPRRMKEMGFGRQYRTDMQTWRIPAGQTVAKPLYNVWAYFPVEYLGSDGLVIESDFGITDFSAAYNEAHFEHTGRVVLDNTTGVVDAFVIAILAIPDIADRTQILTIST